MDQSNIVFNDLIKYTAKGNSSGAARVLCTHQDALYYSLKSVTTNDRRRARRVLTDTREVLRKTPSRANDDEDASALERLSVISNGRVALLRLALRLRSETSYDIHQDICRYDYALWRKIHARILIWTYAARRFYRPTASR